MTDQDGKYLITAEDTDAIIFSYIGYLTQEIPINGRNEINVTLAENIGTLQEARCKRLLQHDQRTYNTGNVSVVKRLRTDPPASG